MDKLSKEQRSRNMAAVRSKANRTTELSVVKGLRGLKIHGWRRHPNYVFGRPDFVFKKTKTALFVDGCFWHGCKKHGNVPKSNRAFWETKIHNNKLRDRRVIKFLQKQGWRVVRIWEHDSKDNVKIQRRLAKIFL